MKFFTINDLDYLAIGAALLGSGGGGDTTYELMIAKRALQEHGPIQIIDSNELNEHDFVVPVCFMGAPVIGQEKIPSGREYHTLIHAIRDYSLKKPTALLADEIGGANAFTPLIMASITGLPVIDGDNIGRAFPELHMSACVLNTITPQPAFLASSTGDIVIIKTNNAIQVEKIARQVTITMGSSALLSMYWMDGKQAQKTIIKNSLSYACALGKLLITARRENKDPIHELITKTAAVLLGTGTVTRIDHTIQDGFLRGQAVITNNNYTITLEYQNENLIAYKNEHGIRTIVATTPDIIIPLNSQTGTPLTTDTLLHGMRVSVIALPAPALWQTTQGLALAGPRAFGYQVDYKPVTKNKPMAVV